LAINPKAAHALEIDVPIRPAAQRRGIDRMSVDGSQWLRLFSKDIHRETGALWELPRELFHGYVDPNRD
jgi:hypothetical protein